jgi:Domain of unknown function (DUF5753)
VTPRYFRRFIDLEADAAEIRSYEGEVVPGLLQTGLQTEDYARALIRSALFRPESASSGATRSVEWGWVPC